MCMFSLVSELPVKTYTQDITPWRGYQSSRIKKILTEKNLTWREKKRKPSVYVRLCVRVSPHWLFFDLQVTFYPKDFFLWRCFGWSRLHRWSADTLHVEDFRSYTGKWQTRQQGPEGTKHQKSFLSNNPLLHSAILNRGASLNWTDEVNWT